jgi:hypothetical protein
MCGIVGAVSSRNIVPILVQGLQRLEYRGYDSCGVAVHAASLGAKQGGLQRARSTARVSELMTQVADDHIEGQWLGSPQATTLWNKSPAVADRQGEWRGALGGTLKEGTCLEGRIYVDESAKLRPVDRPGRSPLCEQFVSSLQPRQDADVVLRRRPTEQDGDLSHADSSSLLGILPNLV